MKAAFTSAIALTALVAFASPAKAQTCEGEGTIQLCGFVWNDTNGNGIQDDDSDNDPMTGDSSGINDLKVTLQVWDSMNNEWDTVAETQTSDGFYFFPDVPDGQYKVVVAAPAGTEPTLLGEGTEETDNDGISDAGGSAWEVVLGPTGVSSQDLDFGFKASDKVSPGTGTPGYWKNHPEAWPPTGITIGGVTYTIEQAISYMGKVSKDKTVSLFSQLVAAKLNVWLGNEDSCIGGPDGALAKADAWMTIHPVGSNVAASTAVWQEIAGTHKDLDDYNNGRLCAPHRN